MSKRVFHQRLKPPLPKPKDFHWPEGQEPERDPDAFYPVPNRAMKRKFRGRYYGQAVGVSALERSRIQRGISRYRHRDSRGVILREGMPRENETTNESEV